jgi:hypothetical protein
MSSSATGKANGNAAIRGRPIRPGEVRNPEGRNQYTYRRDFETSIGRLLNGELTDAEAEQVPEWVQALVNPGMARGEALAHITVLGALRGEKHLLEALKRIWPVVTKAEVSGAEGQPLLVPRLEPPDFSMLAEEDRATLRRIAAECLMRRPDEDV